MELDASLHMVHVFQLWCRLSTEPITVTVDYEWKPATYKTCKVFGHLCKTPVEASTVSMEDLLKIKLEGILFMLVSHYEEIAYPLFVVVMAKSITHTYVSGGIDQQIQPSINQIKG